MENILHHTREKFLECNWESDIAENDHYGYSTIMQSLQASAKKMLDAERAEEHKILEFLSRAASMRLIPGSLNEPFKPILEDFQMGRRSTIPEDFTMDELSFFEQILDDISEPFLKARLADILWLLRKPKNINHARLAIDAYIDHEIDEKSWHKDLSKCLERGARLAIQIKDWERLEQIKGLLFTAFLKDYPASKFMHLWIADLLDTLKIDNDLRPEIAQTLYDKANDLKNNGDFFSAISYFELSSKKNKQCDKVEKYVESLVAIAECHVSEAEKRSLDSNLVANGFYENAVQAYRRIPVRYRSTYDIENKIIEIRQKITSSGQASLDEMVSFTSPSVDVSELIQSSIKHVTAKATPQEALLFFTGVSHPIKYEQLLESANDVLKTSIFGSLFGGRHLSSDGRVIAITPGRNLTAGDDDPANQAVLLRQAQSQFSIHIEFAVQAQILPSLKQLQLEHRFSKDLMIAICKQSPIVQDGREVLLGNALWLGFENEFGLAIYLLCPQVEHIVRLLLKEAGAITTNLSIEGIENENGLSTLMELPEAELIFGKDLTFEIKSIFTEALGYNLRNNVAHGLLNDDESTSIASIYAWWMILRLIIRSIIHGKIRID
jgi:tetratricopeptide (TPR) repeat protein